MRARLQKKIADRHGSKCVTAIYMTKAVAINSAFAVDALGDFLSFEDARITVKQDTKGNLQFESIELTNRSRW